ncbi:polysaccharide biosynthesis/export family protein [Parvibaculum sedimenti]|nr:polysaccharide biosynthesis/export family protein [Parvibaculum sedimenti]
MSFTSAHLVRRAVLNVVMAAGLMALAACATSGAGQSQAPAAAPAASAAAPSEVAYVLGAGDKLRVIVYGEQDLSGEFDVTGTGKVSLPLVGQVQAAGLTLDQFEKETRDKLSQGYLTNPKVSAEVLNYRPFYILGEVDKPGQYPYTSDMTVLNAIAVAGGYTYRANNDTVYITRGNGAEAQYPASQQVKVLPGDVVRVPERFF